MKVDSGVKEAVEAVAASWQWRVLQTSGITGRRGQGKYMLYMTTWSTSSGKSIAESIIGSPVTEAAAGLGGAGSCAAVSFVVRREAVTIRSARQCVCDWTDRCKDRRTDAGTGAEAEPSLCWLDSRSLDVEDGIAMRCTAYFMEESNTRLGAYPFHE